MADQSVTIVHRESSVYVSTFFNEIVTCRLADGRVRRLLAKRGSPQQQTYGHRGGVSYEAEVYRRVTEPLGATVPKFYAAHANPATGETTLFIDFIEGATRLEFADPAAVVDAARWIGTFHRVNEPRVSALATHLNRYDSPYYVGWAQRTLEFSRGLSLPWLATLVRRFDALAAELQFEPMTVIHGEYYPKNILVCEGAIYPVDWESAAIASGEIDLASLTEGWPDEDTKACEAEYCRARWTGEPSEFRRRLAIARMYLLFRWLGDRPEWTVGDEAEAQFECLRQLGEQLGALR